MNLNIISYGIYMTITIYIIIVVGKICYRNGNVFVSELIPDHTALCQQINKILLLAYYLLNIGYCAMTLVQWEGILGFAQMIEVIAGKSAIIICAISILHYFNIIILTKYAKKLIH